MGSMEPGLDRHEWESLMQQLEPDLADDPVEALPELYNLVERMLEERGYMIDDPVARELGDPEVVAEFSAAGDVARAVEQAKPVGPGDVANAIRGLRAIYDHLISERSTP